LTLELEIEYPDEATAKAVFVAVEPDNAGYVESEIGGSKIVFRMSADNAGTMRNTADDLLACIKIAEESAGCARNRSGKIRSDGLDPLDDLVDLPVLQVGVEERELEHHAPIHDCLAYDGALCEQLTPDLLVDLVAVLEGEDDG